MNLDALYSELTLKTKTKLALVVLDGLGDIATKEQNYLTPLEAATTPNLDKLAKDSAQGRMIPAAPGITPGSGPGHLGLFGYDPLEFQVGRGVIEALGLGMELKPGDVCARANFATLDAKGIVTDRRAGRIPTETCEKLVRHARRQNQKNRRHEVIIKAGKEHRFVVVFRGKGLEGPLTDADPNREGFAIPTVKPRDPKKRSRKKWPKLIADFYKAALPVIAKEKPANGFLMRGIAHQPHIPLFEERYLLKPACLAVYPMYKGLAQLVGMVKIEGPQTIKEQFERYLAEYDNYDFFFIHYKYTDKYGEDGNFMAKKKAIEDFDAALPILLRKKPDVLAITGDHSTPCALQGPFVASAAGAAALGVQRLGQAGTLHRNRREQRLARRVPGEIPHPPDAGEREDVRQVRRVIFGLGGLVHEAARQKFLRSNKIGNLKMNLPNKLTVSRFVLTVVFLWALFWPWPIPFHNTLALFFFCLAGVTDFLDGRIARSRGLITNFGI
jgi:2,3-bisphosphoglycerate-independent phosphoglycerate mutase